MVEKLLTTTCCALKPVHKRDHILSDVINSSPLCIGIVRRD